MSTILVTGGAGFIGSHLVQLLVEQGEKVRVLERASASAAHLPSSVEWVQADLRNRSAVIQAVRGCRQVYHLAANPNLWTQQRGHFYQVNFQGTVHVLEAALQAGVDRILHTSTESILTRASQLVPIAENQRVRPDDVVGPYCRSKYQAERYAMRLAKAGQPIVIVSPTLPVGPGDRGRSPPTQMILDFCLGKRSAYLDAELNLIDVRDVAAGMIRAMAVGQLGRRYLLGHENLSIRELFTVLAQLLGLPEPRWRVPYPLALAVAYVSEWVADVLTHHPPAATVTGVKLTRRRMHFDPEHSLAELQLTPRPVRQSLADAVGFFRESGWLAPSARTPNGDL